MHISEEVCLPFLSEFEVLNAILFGFVDNLVIDVGDIHTEFNVVAKVVSENSPNHVITKVVSGMPHVTIRVDCWTTSVPFNISTVPWDESLQLIGETVFKFKTCTKMLLHS